MKKILFPEYRSNDIENYLVLFSICPIRFSNLPGFSQPWLPVEMGDFLHKARFKKLHIYFVLLRMESPLNKLFILGGRLFHSPTRAKASSSNRCAVNRSWNLLIILAHFLRWFLERNFSENLCQNLNEVTEFSQVKF